MAAENKIRLVALYAIRYEKQPNNALPILLDLLVTAGNVPSYKVNTIPKLLAYHHSLQAPPVAGGFSDLFESTSFFSGARDRFKGLKGVENVYTQHSPRLEATLQNLIKGRLKELQYPFLESGGHIRDKPQDIIIFMVGGATYEEAKMVAQVNASSPGVRVVLAGTSIHNSTSFLEEVDDVVKFIEHPDHLEELDVPAPVGEGDPLPGKGGADRPEQVDVLLPGPDDPAVPGNLPVDGNK